MKLVALNVEAQKVDPGVARLCQDGRERRARHGDGALHADVSARESKHGATDEAVSLECPRAVVVDWPDILHRGVMLDVSRDRVWTMATLRATVRRLAHMKVNQLQLYMEHTFQYHDHREVWHGSGAYSGSVLCVSLL